MKRFFFYIMLIIGSCRFVPVVCQDSINIELSFQKEDFTLNTNSEGLVRIIASEGSYFYSEEPDKPALPSRSVDILVPEGAELIDFDFSFETEEYPQEMRLSKNELPLSFNDANGANINVSASAFSGTFPQEVLSYNSKEMMQGYTWLNFTVSPFLYDSQSGILSLIHHLKIILTYNHHQDLKLSPIRKEQLIQSLKERVENPEDFSVYYLDKEQSVLKSSKAKLDYLIITSQALKEEFKPLIEWKQRKGLKAEIITLDEIYSRYDAATPQLKIKHCLREYYEDRNLTWVLLGGDHEIVPVQACYGVVAVTLVDNTIPTDLFYACFDKSFDWNGTIDEKIGEPYFDFVDILPEVYIARAPVNNPEEVEVFVRKSIEYELFTPQKDFAEKILMSGMKSWNIWDGKSDNHHWNEKMFHSYVKSGWSGKKYGYYDTGSDFTGGENYQLTASGLADQINSGYSIFHFAGHGNSTSIIMEEGAGFSVKEASSLKNNAVGVILSSSCYINSFDRADPCLSEALMRNPYGGCVAFWGSARDAWGLPNISENLGPSYLFNAKFLENLYKEGQAERAYSFAALCSNAKANISGNSTIAGAYWFLQYSLNAMGDPELPIYSQNPSIFDNVRIYKWDNHLTVNTGGISNCRICITSEDLELGFQEVAEGVSYFTFDNLPESYQVTITKRNFIPYRYISAITSAYNADFISSVRIYPNPAKEEIYIDFNHQKGLLYLYDVNGKIQKEKDLIFGSNILSLLGFSEGTYILKIVSDQGMEYKKLIKF